MLSVPPTGRILIPPATAAACTSEKTSSARRRIERCASSLPSGALLGQAVLAGDHDRAGGQARAGALERRLHRSRLRDQQREVERLVGLVGVEQRRVSDRDGPFAPVELAHAIAAVGEGGRDRGVAHDGRDLGAGAGEAGGDHAADAAAADDGDAHAADPPCLAEERNAAATFLEGD
jgi:hypothetical protein